MILKYCTLNDILVDSAYLRQASKTIADSHEDIDQSLAHVCGCQMTAVSILIHQAAAAKRENGTVKCEVSIEILWR